MERTLSHLMSSHTSLAQVLSLFTFIHGHHPGAPSLTRFSLFYFYLFFPVFSFSVYFLHSELYSELDNPIVMESLCYSANKESEDAYDVSTSLTVYNPLIKNSKEMIRELGNVKLFESCETISKEQCSHCLLFWNQGIAYCTCR